MRAEPARDHRRSPRPGVITKREDMTRIVVILDGKKIRMWFEPRLLEEFDAWRADRRLFNRSEAIRSMIRWAVAHDDTGRQRHVQPDDATWIQLTALMQAHTLLARTEAVKLAILTVLRQPWPVGNGRPERKKLRKGVPGAFAPPRLVVNNEEGRDA